ncbi:hypothetical protein [Catenovulum agarivorans]|uniref:hypothetical protein n=1 Tax=Catenovulum agarivorans TaxID=1172192 RepID=UPI0002EEBC1D|nr:hypothetical protein [Catenovulum agarivorans]
MKNVRKILIVVSIVSLIAAGYFYFNRASTSACINIIEALYQNHSQVILQKQTKGGWSWKVDMLNPNLVAFAFNTEQVVDLGGVNEPQRIQANMYAFTIKPSYISNSFTLKLNESMTPAIQSNIEFEWFTIFELWNDPGWVDSEYPFRIAINLIKRPENKYLTPVLWGQYKVKETASWETLWQQALEMQITPHYAYKFYMEFDLFGVPSMFVSITNMEIQHEVTFTSSENLVHPKQANKDGFWGVNPIKLYTGTNVLNSMKQQSSPVSVTFSNARLCYR